MNTAFDYDDSFSINDMGPLSEGFDSYIDWAKNLKEKATKEIKRLRHTQENACIKDSILTILTNYEQELHRLIKSTKSRMVV